MDQEELEAAQRFELDNPELVCRWRLAGGVLPLDNRHLRALSRRVVAQKDVSPHLIAWAKQHIEGTLKEGSQEYPDGVLMILLESNGQAAMTVGPYQSLEESSCGPRKNFTARRAANSLCTRSALASKERKAYRRHFRRKRSIRSHKSGA